MSEFPEPVIDPQVTTWLQEPTDPRTCTCRHDDLPAAWHLWPCPNKVPPPDAAHAAHDESEA